MPTPKSKMKAWIKNQLLSRGLANQPNDVRFTVPGDPRGYRAVGRDRHSPVATRTWAWYEECRQAAMAAGVSMPLVATDDRRLLIKIMVWYRKPSGRNPDAGNVYKGLVDALFYAGKGSPKNDDFAVVGSFDYGYDADNPRVDVRVRKAGPKK